MDHLFPDLWNLLKGFKMFLKNKNVNRFKTYIYIDFEVKLDLVTKELCNIILIHCLVININCLMFKRKNRVCFNKVWKLARIDVKNVKFKTDCILYLNNPPTNSSSHDRISARCAMNCWSYINNFNNSLQM